VPEKYGLRLYALVVEDAHCCEELAALMFTKRETVFSIKTMLERVSHKQSREHSHRHHRQGGSTVNDKLVLPNVQIQLCVFYVLKAIHVSMVLKIS